MSATRVIACCGVGGSGKTTAAAAIGVALAQRGERAVVLTIDPARRLADALGVDVLGNQPQPVPMDAIGGGRLDAMMLDRKATFDDLVQRHAPDPDTAARLLANPYYAAVSTRLTGSHEYMATEKLQQLVEAGRWDAVVLDTPPAQHAIEFFTAPQRVSRLFEQGVLSVLTAPGRGLAGAATRQAVKLLERVAGALVLEDISEFFRLISGLSGVIRDRNAAVYQLLHSDRTRFLLVSPPQEDQQDDVADFARALKAQGMGLSGILVNRVVLPPHLSRPITAERLPHGLPPSMVDALLALPARIGDAARQHAIAVSKLSTAAGGAPAAVLPDLPGGIRTIEGLAELVPYLPADL